jgi:hypothetical protein
MDLCAQWGVPPAELDRSMGIAAGRGDEAAVRWCHDHGARDYAMAITYARNSGNVQIVPTLIDLAPEELRPALQAKALEPLEPPPAWLKP